MMNEKSKHLLTDLEAELKKLRSERDRYIEDSLSIEEFWKIVLDFVNKWILDVESASLFGESTFQSLNSLIMNLRDRFQNFKTYKDIGDSEKSRNEEKYFGQIVGSLIYRFNEIMSDTNTNDDLQSDPKNDEDYSLDEDDWQELIRSIKNQSCVPFIGVEVCSPWISLSDLSLQWTKEYEYPFEDSTQLARVAHYIAIDKGSVMTPKNKLIRMLENIPIPSFSSKTFDANPYTVLSNLDLPIYITTNYDHFMEECLKQFRKEPISEVLLWNEQIRKQAKNRGFKSIFDKGSKYKPTKDNPLVYHLHGDVSLPESLVLTETDYIDFVINLSRENETRILPPIIRSSLTTKSLLFIGYNFEEINFRVIFQALLGLQEIDIREISIAVQLPPRLKQDKRSKAIKYLREYTKEMKVHIYWGSTIEFINELDQRLKKNNVTN